MFNTLNHQLIEGDCSLRVGRGGGRAGRWAAGVGRAGRWAAGRWLKLKNPIFEARPPDRVAVSGAKVLGPAGQGVVEAAASGKGPETAPVF
ncbi:hypothetical protein TYRP_009217 [Tyrophagus putrescentiae]|nr:hypothetical protein TYRP_009217 [Tyrophagus putrescentiae]